MAGVMESMKRGAKSIINDPGKHAEKIKSNVAGKGKSMASGAKKVAKGAGSVATRGTGLGPARGLRDVLMEAKRKVMGE